MTAIWHSVPLSEAPVAIIDGDRGAAYPKKSDFSPTGDWLFLDTGNVRKDGFDFSSCQFITDEKERKLRKGRLSRYDVVLTTRGTIGNVGYFGDRVPFSSIRINSGMVILRADAEQLLPAFLFQVMRSEAFRAQIRALTSGAAQPQLPIRDIRLIKVPVPPLPQQKSIASILGAYDDLIEVNRRRIAVLEEMALRLFEEWLVRFRIPGHLEAPAEGALPNGWQRLGLHDVAEVAFGFAFKSPHFNADGRGCRVVRIRDVLTGETGTFTDEPFDPYYGVVDGDLLIGMDGIFHTSIWVGGAAALNQRVTRLRPKDGRSTMWLLQAVLPKIKHLEATISGTTVAHLSARDLKALSVIVAPKDVQRRVDGLLKPVGDAIVVYRHQQQRLAASRDLLLHRLVSGELSVAAAERELEVAA